MQPRWERKGFSEHTAQARGSGPPGVLESKYNSSDLSDYDVGKLEAVQNKCFNVESNRKEGDRNQAAQEAEISAVEGFR